MQTSTILEDLFSFMWRKFEETAGKDDEPFVDFAHRYLQSNPVTHSRIKDGIFQVRLADGIVLSIMPVDPTFNAGEKIDPTIAKLLDPRLGPRNIDTSGVVMVTGRPENYEKGHTDMTKLQDAVNKTASHPSEHLDRPGRYNREPS